MKRNSLSIRAVTAIGALCGAIMIPSISHATGAVSVNSATVCPSSATMSLTPAGDINITCTASGPPSCTVAPASSTIGAGQSVTLTANCNPAATGYAWTPTGGGPTMSGQSALLPFPTPGTFTYSVTGSNGSGPGPASAAATVVVQTNTVVPVCSVSATPASISAGGASTVTAICNPAATNGYAWTPTGGGPTMSGQSASLTFPVAGTFSYSVVGTNSVGPSLPLPAATASVVVAPAGSCVPKAVTGGFTANGIRNLAIDRGSSVTYSMPIYSVAGRTIEILSIQSTSSQSDLTSEFSVSTCPGDFDNMQADCKTWGTVNQSGTQLFATTNANPVNGTCTLILGTQYYINVRNTRYDRVSPACTPQTCYMILQLNSY